MNHTHPQFIEEREVADQVDRACGEMTTSLDEVPEPTWADEIDAMKPTTTTATMTTTPNQRRGRGPDPVIGVEGGAHSVPSHQRSAPCGSWYQPGGGPAPVPPFAPTLTT